MPYAMKDIIGRAHVPPRLSLEVDTVGDRINVIRDFCVIGSVSRREIDDTNGRIDNLLKRYA